jgi:RNA polymerase sigma-70 factor (ECF subfamily)
MERQSDRELEAAFIEVQHGLRGFLRRRLPDTAIADDLLQDVFVKALESERAGRRIQNPTGWLFAAARTTLIDYYRASGRPMEELDENLPESDTDDTAAHQELANCLGPMMAGLPPRYRDTLIATELQGETMREHAQRESVSLSAIKSRGVRARALLKEKLLRCCQLQISNGLVSDYRPKDTTGCGASCTTNDEAPAATTHCAKR